MACHILGAPNMALHLSNRKLVSVGVRQVVITLPRRSFRDILQLTIHRWQA
jgi:hypothetical protein